MTAKKRRKVKATAGNVAVVPGLVVEGGLPPTPRPLPCASGMSSNGCKLAPGGLSSMQRTARSPPTRETPARARFCCGIPRTLSVVLGRSRGSCRGRPSGRTLVLGVSGSDRPGIPASTGPRLVVLRRRDFAPGFPRGGASSSPWRSGKPEDNRRPRRRLEPFVERALGTLSAAEVDAGSRRAAVEPRLRVPRGLGGARSPGSKGYVRPGLTWVPVPPPPRSWRSSGAQLLCFTRPPWKTAERRSTRRRRNQRSARSPSKRAA